MGPEKPHTAGTDLINVWPRIRAVCSHAAAATFQVHTKLLCSSCVEAWVVRDALKVHVVDEKGYNVGLADGC